MPILPTKKVSKQEAGAKKVRAVARPAPTLRSVLFWVCVLLLVLVPLVFTTAVYRVYVLPKFSALLVGSSVVVLLIALMAALNAESRQWLRAVKSRHAVLVCLYFAAVGMSTFASASPIASLFGTDAVQMGFITQLCFLPCFAGLVVAIGTSNERLKMVLWAMSLTGLLAAVYAFAQFAGRDPFLPASLYTFESAAGPVVRVPGPLGHSNYLGNFLLYTTGLSAGLAFASRGQASRIAFAATAISLAAIAFSGTRGAWLGAAVSLATFVIAEIKRGEDSQRWWNRRRFIGAAAAIAIVVVSTAIIISSPFSRSIGLRARSFVTDRLTGSGRTLLWRDAVGMVPVYAVIGCGPEGFNRAFLAYKSEELARYSPNINNESSHNSYLDAAISYGLPGALLYVAIIASAFLLLIRSRRRAVGRDMRFIITGLVSSLAGVVVHNFFIYDQIPTGLYFFAFMALPLSVSSVIGAQQITKERRGKEAAPALAHSQAEGLGEPRPSITLRSRAWAWRSVIAAAFVFVAAACWFVISEARADVAIKRAFASAKAGDLQGLISHGERATRSLNPTGAYDFLFARALAIYVDKTRPDPQTTVLTGLDIDELKARRKKAVEMGISYAEKSAGRSLTPGSNYLLMGYLARAAGDVKRLRAYAIEAIRLDPNFFGGHWMMAEAHLDEGDREGAVREAKLALRFRPGWSDAELVLARAEGRKPYGNPRVEDLVQRACKLIDAGNAVNAQMLLRRAIRVSGEPCAVCHKMLAQVYEKQGRYGQAIAAWQAYISIAPDDAAREEARSRIEFLRQKTG